MFTSDKWQLGVFPSDRPPDQKENVFPPLPDQSSPVVQYHLICSRFAPIIGSPRLSKRAQNIPLVGIDAAGYRYAFQLDASICTDRDKTVSNVVAPPPEPASR